MALPYIHGSQPAKIHDFYEKLLSNVQALETLGKLREICGYVRMTTDKLEGIRGDLVRTDDDWQEWEFPQLVLALRKWTERNPQTQDDRAMEKPPLGVQPFKKRKPSRPSSRKRSLNRAFIVKRADTDLAIAAKLLLWRSERKYVLIKKQLCFNCAGTKHKAFECRSQVSCLFCKRRDHSSICDRGSTEHMVVATGDTTVTYPL